MGPRERYTSAVGWIADHIAILLFIFALAGGTAAVVTASMSTLSAFAPFSYLIAAFAGAILTTLSIWSLWAFVRWVRHGPSEPPQIPHLPPEPFVTVTPWLNESPDITEAKTRLCAFVMDTLSPAITSMGEALRAGSSVIQYGNKDNFLAGIARDGAAKAVPSRPSVDVFLDVQSVRAKPLVDIEKDALKHITEYSRSFRVLHDVLKAVKSDNTRRGWWYRQFDEAYPSWLSLHKKFVHDLNRVSADSHLPRIGAAMKLISFDNEGCPASELEGYTVQYVS